MRPAKGAQDCIARARFQIKIVKKLSQAERLWKMRSAKSARDCESSVSQKNRTKMKGPEHFWKMRSAKGARDWSWLAVAASWQAHHHLNPNVYHIIIK